MIRLVQISHPDEGRRVALVAGDRLQLLNGPRSVYACALQALQNRETLSTLVTRIASEETLDYTALYTAPGDGQAAETPFWRLLPAFDHPDEPARCLVSGTGLTHRKSADNRNAMHQNASSPQIAADAEAAGASAPTPLTDSMKIYAWGEQGGRPESGSIGVQPEWFYKGNGTILRAHGEPLDVPAYAEDGGEEAEIAAAYIVAADGVPWRVGFAQGNEFSDHRMEARNYLYLAPSKLRACALGPELLVNDQDTAPNAAFADVHGIVKVLRGGEPLWTQEIVSGEANMVHTLANLEHHHFKYAAHRRPGDAHIHFFGTGGFSFGSGVQLAEGDTMVVAFENYGRPLSNPLHIENGPPTLRTVGTL